MRIFFLLVVFSLIDLSLMGNTLIENAQAESWYRWVDQSGKVHYGDLPPANAVKVQKQKGGIAPQSDSAVPYETRRAQQDFPVMLYVMEECGDPCKQARELLNKRGVPFAENNLKTAEQWAAFKKMSGAASLPALTVGKVWLTGFLAEQWHSELDIAGYPKTASYRALAPAKEDKPAQKK